MDTCSFNEAYYEHGIESGVSLYQNYRWIPELTIPMAMTIIDYLKIPRSAKVLDFGCAKGYTVKAFRLLHRLAWGVDSSLYAIEHSESNCYRKNGEVVFEAPSTFPSHFDYCIAKDVFEHIPLIPLHKELRWLSLMCDSLFAIVPLGDGVRFYCPLNDKDTTHLLAHGERWWKDMFRDTGWRVNKFSFRIDGIKDFYYDNYPKAHGFFTLKSKSN